MALVFTGLTLGRYLVPFDIQHRNKIVLSMMDRAIKYAKGVERKHGISYEDVAQDCALKMIERLDRSDPGDVEAPEAYVMFCIKEGCRSAINKHYSRKRTNEREGAVIGEDWQSGEVNPASPAGDVDWILRRKLEKLRDVFNKNERIVLDGMYYGGAVDLSDVAAMSGIKQQRASEANRSLLKKVAGIAGVEPVVQEPARSRAKRRIDATVYPFESVDTGEVMRMTRADFTEMVGGNGPGVSKLITGKKPSYRGWRILS